MSAGLWFVILLGAVLIAWGAGVLAGRHVALKQARRETLVGHTVAVVTADPGGETYRGTLRSELDDALKSGWIVLRDVQVVSTGGNQSIGGLVRIPVAATRSVQDFTSSADDHAVVSA